MFVTLAKMVGIPGLEPRCPPSQTVWVTITPYSDKMEPLAEIESTSSDYKTEIINLYTIEAKSTPGGNRTHIYFG